MAHAVSASYLRSDRMSPEGWALALLLHVLAAFLLWWMSQNRPPIIPTEDVVEVSFELPKAPQPPPPAPTPTAPPTPAPPIEGLRPPAEITSENPTQVRPTAQNPSNQNVPLSAPQSLERAIPKEDNEPPPPTSQAFAQPQPKPQPQPAPTPPQDATEKARQQKAIEEAFEKSRPPLPKVEPKPQPPKPPPPQQQHAAIAVPPANPSPRPPAAYQPRPTPQIAPSPLSRLPQQQHATAVARGADAPQTSSFVNPADTYNKARAGDNYLWEVVRRLQGYRYQANVQASSGITVVSVTIARDGRLLNVAVLSSSGFPEMDRGVLAGVRAGSPYSPLPDTIQGASATFRLPLISSRGP